MPKFTFFYVGTSRNYRRDAPPKDLHQLRDRWSGMCVFRRMPPFNEKCVPSEAAVWFRDHVPLLIDNDKNQEVLLDRNFITKDLAKQLDYAPDQVITYEDLGMKFGERENFRLNLKQMKQAAAANLSYQMKQVAFWRTEIPFGNIINDEGGHYITFSRSESVLLCPGFDQEDLQLSSAEYQEAATEEHLRQKKEFSKLVQTLVTQLHKDNSVKNLCVFESMPGCSLGHVDTFMQFVRPPSSGNPNDKPILLVGEYSKYNDEDLGIYKYTVDYEVLMAWQRELESKMVQYGIDKLCDVRRIPMPLMKLNKESYLTYANALLVNGLVFVPRYFDFDDKAQASVLVYEKRRFDKVKQVWESIFGKEKVHFCDCKELSKGHGVLRCSIVTSRRRLRAFLKN